MKPSYNETNIMKPYLIMKPTYNETIYNQSSYKVVPVYK